MNKKAAAVAEAAGLPSTVFHAGESELLIIQRLFSPPFPVRVKRKKRGRKKNTQTHTEHERTSERIPTLGGVVHRFTPQALP